MATSCGSVHTGRLHERWPRSLLRTSLLVEGNREARSEPEEGSGWHNQLGLKGTMASVWLKSKTGPQQAIAGSLAKGPVPQISQLLFTSQVTSEVPDGAAPSP